MQKKTIVIGASANPERYSYKAVSRLAAHNIEVVPLGAKKGMIEGIPIQNTPDDFKDIHTVSMYLNPDRQKAYYDYILSLHPKRIIFNPGAENPELRNIAEKNGIEAVEVCTLVMLSTDQF